jgi:hypothetical protein
MSKIGLSLKHATLLPSFFSLSAYNILALALRANPTRNNLDGEDTINGITELSCGFLKSW